MAYISHFLKVMTAEMRKQHQNYFFDKSIYVSLFLWPILTFITAYYSYKPFRLDKITGGIAYVNERNLLVFVLIGYLTLSFFRCFVQSAWRFSFERQSGTLELIYMSPGNRFAVVLGNAVSSLFESIWLLLVFGLGIFILHSAQLKVNVPGAIVSVLLLVLLSMLWGILLNSLFLFSRDSGFLFTILEEPMEIFGGVKVPNQVFPLWAKGISYIFPLTYSAEMVRQVFLNGATFLELLPFWRISLLISLLMFGSSLLCLHLGERHAKVTGNMALF